MGGNDYNLAGLHLNLWKLRNYYSAPELWRCPSDNGKASLPYGYQVLGSSYRFAGTRYGFFGSSYMYNSNWYGIRLRAGDPWNNSTLRGKRVVQLEQHSRVVTFSDATIQYTYPYWSWNTPIVHGAEFIWHDPPANNPDELFVDGVWFYPPLCPVSFLDGHASFIRLGPEDPSNPAVNGETYIIDPKDPF